MSDELQGGNSAAVADAGPMTFDRAFAADVTPASDPATSHEDAPAAGMPDASAVPGQPSPSVDDGRSPQIPRARFDEVNGERNELKAWRESHAWAEQYDPAAAQTMTQWYTRAQADPRTFALSLLDELAAHPYHGPAVRSELARRLGSGSRQPKEPAAPTMPEPDVEITDGQGRVVGRTYSSESLQKRDAFLRQQIASEMDAKYAGHFQTLDEIRTASEQYAAQTQANQFGHSFAQELAALPHFEEHKVAIGQQLAALKLASDHPDAVRAAAYKLYHQIVGPTLLNGGKQQAAAEFQRKAHAATAVSPSAGVSNAPISPSSFHDAGLKW